MRKTAVDHGRPAPPRSRGKSEKHRLNETAMGSIACNNRNRTPVGWVSAPWRVTQQLGRPERWVTRQGALTQPTPARRQRATQGRISWVSATAVPNLLTGISATCSFNPARIVAMPAAHRRRDRRRPLPRFYAQAIGVLQRIPQQLADASKTARVRTSIARRRPRPHKTRSGRSRLYERSIARAGIIDAREPPTVARHYCRPATGRGLCSGTPLQARSAASCAVVDGERRPGRRHGRHQLPATDRIRAGPRSGVARRHQRVVSRHGAIYEMRLGHHPRRPSPGSRPKHRENDGSRLGFIADRGGEILAPRRRARMPRR
jgi:hypothetical protein